MRKRSKYRPKPMLINPLGYVMESISPVSDQKSYLLDIKIKNSDAMVSLMQGKCTKKDMDFIINMSNITEALQQMGFGQEYKNIAIDGRCAIVSIVERARIRGKFTPTGPETQMLNLLMELHDAQMEVITVRDMEKAIQLVQAQLNHAKDTIRLATLEIPIQ